MLVPFRRWEVYHGHNSEAGEWGSQSKNPRQPNSLSFEAIQSCDIDAKSAADISLIQSRISSFESRIGLEYEKAMAMATKQHDDADGQSATSATTIMTATNGTSLENPKPIASDELKGTHQINSTKCPENMPSAAKYPAAAPPVPTEQKVLPNLPVDQESAEYYCLAAHLLSPSSCGLYDELMALVKMEVLTIDRSGIPSLSPEWYSKVDIVILDDMHRCWGSDVDQEGRFCIEEEMRDTLEDQWVKSDYGWSMKEDPDDLVFDFEVIAEWREAFEGRMEEKANYTEGVGRFGL
eukprot:scaffold1334_cov123-Cylindrotheca_fusiformis.AAC.2